MPKDEKYERRFIVNPDSEDREPDDPVCEKAKPRQRLPEVDLEPEGQDDQEEVPEDDGPEELEGTPAKVISPPLFRFLLDLGASHVLKSLTLRELKSLLSLCHHAKFITGVAYPGLELLVKLTGIERTDLQDALKSLEDKGLVKTLEVGSGSKSTKRKVIFNAVKDDSPNTGEGKSPSPSKMKQGRVICRDGEGNSSGTGRVICRDGEGNSPSLTTPTQLNQEQTQEPRASGIASQGNGAGVEKELRRACKSAGIYCPQRDDYTRTEEQNYLADFLTACDTLDADSLSSAANDWRDRARMKFDNDDLLPKLPKAKFATRSDKNKSFGGDRTETDKRIAAGTALEKRIADFGVKKVEKALELHDSAKCAEICKFLDGKKGKVGVGYAVKCFMVRGYYEEQLKEQDGGGWFDDGEDDYSEDD